MFINLTLPVDINDPVINKASNDPNSYMSKGHIGTHLDVYAPQVAPPVEYCESKGVFIDVSAVRDAEIGEEILEGIELKKGDFLLIYAGWLEDRVYGSKEYFKDHPQFSWGLVHELARREFSFVGLDFAGMRRGLEHETADKKLAEGSAYVIENMANLDKIKDYAGNHDIRMLTGWTGFTGSSGWTCSVVADVNAR